MSHLYYTFFSLLSRSLFLQFVFLVLASFIQLLCPFPMFDTSITKLKIKNQYNTSTQRERERERERDIEHLNLHRLKSEI